MAQTSSITQITVCSPTSGSARKWVTENIVPIISGGPTPIISPIMPNRLHEKASPTINTAANTPTRIIVVICAAKSGRHPPRTLKIIIRIALLTLVKRNHSHNIIADKMLKNIAVYQPLSQIEADAIENNNSAETIRLPSFDGSAGFDGGAIASIPAAKFFNCFLEMNMIEIRP